MKKVFFLLCGFISLCCSAQETKLPKQTIVSTPMVTVSLRGIRSAGVKGCDNCNVSGRLASSLGLTSFTVDSLAGFKYNEKQNTLEVKYLISDLRGKPKPGGVSMGGPFGNPNPHAGQSPCSQYGLGCPPPPNRIGKTKYEIKTEGEKNFLVVKFLEDLKVEKGFFDN